MRAGRTAAALGLSLAAHGGLLALIAAAPPPVPHRPEAPPRLSIAAEAARAARGAAAPAEGERAAAAPGPRARADGAAPPTTRAEARAPAGPALPAMEAAQPDAVAPVAGGTAQRPAQAAPPPPTPPAAAVADATAPAAAPSARLAALAPPVARAAPPAAPPAAPAAQVAASPSARIAARAVPAARAAAPAPPASSPAAQVMARAAAAPARVAAPATVARTAAASPPAARPADAAPATSSRAVATAGAEVAVPATAAAAAAEAARPAAPAGARATAAGSRGASLAGAVPAGAVAALGGAQAATAVVPAATGWSGALDAALDPQSLALAASFTAPAADRTARDGLAALLAAAPCSRLEAAFDPEAGAILLRGHVPDRATGERLLADVALRAGGSLPVRPDLVVLPAPQCGALELAARLPLPQSNGQRDDPLAVGAAAAAARYTAEEGAEFPLALTAPDYPAWIHVTGFDAGGRAVHLSPTRFAPPRPRRPAERFTIGRGAEDGSGIRLRAAPPFGATVVLVVAASAPLFDPLRPDVEPAETYLRALEARIETLRAEDPGFRGEWAYLLVRTHAAGTAPPAPVALAP